MSSSRELTTTTLSYEERLNKYLSESEGLSPLEKHLFLFLDKDKTFSPITVSTELTLMRGHMAKIKGMIISGFNASHGSNSSCPVMSAIFNKDQDDYARFLHLGTTRCWNADGSINEDRYRQFITTVTAGKTNSHGEPVVTLSRLKQYLSDCLEKDPEEQTSHRRTFGFFPSISKCTQAFAATAAWDEVFDRLACGWLPVDGKPTELEPYLSLQVTKEFFYDSPRAFLRAECGLLPIEKPAVVNTPVASMS